MKYQWKLMRKDIQGVFQDASGTLNPRQTVLHNIEKAMKYLTNFSKKERLARICYFMDKANLNKSLLKSYPYQISGGEQRRVALIRALCVEPKYLILDEVLSGLDIVSQRNILELLKGYGKQNSYGCLFITHDMDSAYEMSDKIFCIKNGNLIKEGNKIQEVNYEKKEINSYSIKPVHDYGRISWLREQ